MQVPFWTSFLALEVIRSVIGGLIERVECLHEVSRWMD